MEKARLIIKYKGEYIVDKIHNEIGFITVPLYNGNSDFFNIDIFVSLLCFGYLNDDFAAVRGFNYEEGIRVFEPFDFDCLQEIDRNTYIYDLDEHISYDEEMREAVTQNLGTLPGSLERHSYEEIKEIAKNNSYNSDDYEDENEPFTFDYRVPRVDDDLLKSLKFLNLKRTDKDVLLLYSGGKDSALTAVRLRNAGYNVYFIHFDNGAMKDADKPYLTFKNSFAAYEGYYFDYQLRSFNVSRTFNEFFEAWRKDNGNVLEGGTLNSEIRCLSCRMAMYVEAISYAKANGFKYIAEGARVSQKFMLEQEEFTDRLKDLASSYGIEIMFPVLHLEDDEAEKQELIDAGFSSKSWESKCLLGREAMEKTPQDEETILEYYENNLMPKVLSKINVLSKYASENWYIKDKS